jgi:hypothetical protein
MSKIKRAVNSSLEKEVFETIREVEQKHIQKDVYNAYKNPNMIYQRRNNSDSLDSDDNIVADVHDGTLVVSNIARPNEKRNQGGMPLDGSLAAMIEFGHGFKGWEYDYGTGNEPYSEARPFTKNTIEELKYSNDIKEAMKKGLKRNNINTQ